MLDKKLLIGLAVWLCSVAISGFAGWTVSGWRHEVEIAQIRAGHEKDRAQASNTALTTLKADANAIHKAATEYAAIETTLAPKIAALTKELRNAKPLPADCRPDPYRVRNLDAAIDAANSSIPR